MDNNFNNSLFAGKIIPIVLQDNLKCYMTDFSRTSAIKYSESILSIHNLIPYVEWTKDDLLADQDSTRYFFNKWNLSALIFIQGEDNPIGFIISFLRLSKDQHPLDSIYIHRFAIAERYQNHGIGKKALFEYTQTIFKKIPWLLNITLQTNDENRNKNQIKLYASIGFKKLLRVLYPEKIDLLLLLSRPDTTISNSINFRTFHSPNIKHPRVSNCDSVLSLHMATSSDLKFQQFRFLFKMFNINLKQISPPIELIEPQVPEPGKEAEQILVSHPLKVFSRFISNDKYLPLIIEDTMLFIEYFNKNFDLTPDLPGHDVKRWWRQFGNEGVLALMSNTSKRRALYVSQIGLYDGKGQYIYARGETKGIISYSIMQSRNPRKDFPKTFPYHFHSIFIPLGSYKTLSIMDPLEFSQFDYRRKCVENLINSKSFKSVSLKRHWQNFKQLELF